MREYVAIVGSRKYLDLDAVMRYVDALPSTAVVISGRAAGVDIAARTAAIKRGLFVVDVPIEPAHWQRHGKAAGPRRNAIIAHLCDRMVAFWDGESRGTQHAMDAAAARGKVVEVITPTAGPSPPAPRPKNQVQ